MSLIVNTGEWAVSLLPVKMQNLGRQFIKFGVVGAIGAVVDFGTYTILSRFFAWDTVYLFLGYEFIAANLVSVPLAIVSNFILNKYWTFKGAGTQVVQQGAGYFLMNLCTFFLNQVLVSFFAFRVPVIEAIFGNKKDYAAKVLAIGLILFINFGGSKLLIFRRQKR